MMCSNDDQTWPKPRNRQLSARNENGENQLLEEATNYREEMKLERRPLVITHSSKRASARAEIVKAEARVTRRGNQMF